MDEIIKRYGVTFMTHVEITPTCWNWKGSVGVRNEKHTPVKYGVFTTSLPKWGRHYAHRFCYQIFMGEIPKGLQLDHTCKNTLCVNPAHLEPVTARENVLRGNTIARTNAAKTHCPKGHPYSGDNLHIRYKKGKPFRECRACMKAKSRAYYVTYRDKKRRKATHLTTP